MPGFLSTHRATLREIAIVGLSGIAAYVASRAAARPTAVHLAHIDTAITQLAFYARRDYWSMYRQVQSDLLAIEETD